MDFNFIDKQDGRNLVKNLFILKFSQKAIPFKTVVLPLGLPALVYVFNEQTTIIKNTKHSLKGLTLFGQFYGAYDYHINEKGINIGINLWPSSLYKILNRDISKFADKHLPLKEVDEKLAQKLESIFLNFKDDITNLEKEIIKLIDSLEITQNKDLLQIDNAVDIIIKKEGLIKVNELLNLIPFSQKSLEIKFKKIIGLTPVKFIKMIRFNNLMIKYQSKEIDIKDLIYMYNYYDKSHFVRDFKFFMKLSPKEFFKQDYPLLQKYLVK